MVHCFLKFREYSTAVERLLITMPKELWNKIRRELQSRVSKETYDCWFKPMTPIERQGETLRLLVPNPIFQEWIQSHYMEILEESALAATGESLRCSLEVKSEEAKGDLILTPPRTPPVQKVPKPVPEEASIGVFNPNYRFERFVVGPSNQFAHAAATAVAQSPSKAYNPLFLYGGVGLGKTHLVQSVGFYLRENSPHLRTAYVSSERFTNEMISSIGNRMQVEFREKYRQVDVLLLDDIQFLAGKTGTQEELFHTFNALHEAQRQIIISSDCHPRELQSIEERLRSRFEWGLIADIQPPDLETKVAILYEKAKGYGVFVPEDVALFFAEKIQSNIRELEGCLIRLIAYSSFKGKPIDMELARETFQSLFNESDQAVSIEEIQKYVAVQFKMRVTDLKAKTKKNKVAFPRQIAMYLSKELTSASLPEMGEKFGGKHHSTVLHSIRKIAQLMKDDPAFQQQILSYVRALR
jgi:chromosomal replication initiator protein